MTSVVEIALLFGLAVGSIAVGIGQTIGADRRALIVDQQQRFDAGPAEAMPSWMRFLVSLGGSFAESMPPIRRWMGDGHRMSRWQRLIVQAGSPFGLTVGAFAALQVGAFAVAILGCALLAELIGLPLLLGVALGLFLGVVPRALLESAAKKRQSQMARQLPGVLDQLVMSAESGATELSGLRSVTREMSGPLIDEIARIADLIDKTSMSIAEAFGDLAERTGLDAVDDLTQSMLLSMKAGSASYAEVLRVQAEMLRNKYEQELRATISKIPTKLEATALGTVFLAMMIVLLGPAILQIVHSFP
jgi:tight adherence protein C